MKVAVAWVRQHTIDDFGRWMHIRRLRVRGQW